MSDIGSMIRDLLPVSRTLAITAFAFSFGSMVLGFPSIYNLVYIPQAIFNLKRPQIWRLLSSFFITGPRWGIVMDPYFLYLYSSKYENPKSQIFVCERLRFRSGPSGTGDFAFFILFCMTIILILNHVLYFGNFVFLSPLTVAFCYYWVAFEPASGRANLFLLPLPIKFLPVAVLVLSGIMHGWEALLGDATGIVAAHLYLFLTEIWPTSGGGRNWLETPAFWNRLFEGRLFERRPAVPPPIVPRRVATETRPSVPAAREPVVVGGDQGATGSMFGSRGSGWTHRGQGHRLGDS